MTWMLLTQPWRGVSGAWMKTQCPAVMMLLGPLNQPVPIHLVPSLAVMISEQWTRQG